jgi:uridine kinase
MAQCYDWSVPDAVFRLLETPQRTDVLRCLSERVLQLAETSILRVAIDGVDGAGKTTFADELAATLAQSSRPVIRASVDGFHNPRKIRYSRGRDSPEGFYFDSYDYAALRRHLLNPLGPDGSRIYRQAVFDHRTDCPVTGDERLAAPNSILVFDGIFLHRLELRSCWEFSAFLSVPFEVSIPRGAQRGPGFGSPDPADPSNRRYIEGQRLYLMEAHPENWADVLIDNTELVAPRILRVRER